MKTLVMMTGNAKKAAEIEAILGVQVEMVAGEIDEVQSMDVAVVARAKAAAAYALVQRPVLIDDTGFGMDALGGLPGALVTWFLQAVDGAGILKMVGNGVRGAEAMTALGYADERGVNVFVGRVRGVLANDVRGDNGFGFDGIFIPDGQPEGARLTQAEMGAEAKNKLSSRKLAAEQLRAFLEKR